VILFSHTLTARLEYISGFIGREICGQEFLLTSDPEEYNQYQGPRINYSHSRISSGECWIPPHSLLQETGIRAQSISCFKCENLPAFFQTPGDFPFDIFAVTFYLLSRYEEYLPHTKDEYGRYAHTNSIAFREGFLQYPLVNQWLLLFGKKLESLFSGFHPETSSFRFYPTYDIDEAFAYRHKSWWRNAGAAMKNLLQFQLGSFRERIAVVRGKKSDPYDAYSWMDELHAGFSSQPVYFFLLAEKTGRYDKNISPIDPAMRELISRHAAQYDIGIHPSWQSGDDTTLLQMEIKCLELNSGKKINRSRQHYIRFTTPQTFRELIRAGINEDFSMGYGSINGFRASAASSYYWYDLEKEEKTSLLLHPFCFMEANSFFEQKYSPQQALEEMRYYYRVIKEVNGQMITIWHNTFLGEANLFRGWREVYKIFLKEVGG
jgi:hypothetical protein